MNTLIAYSTKYGCTEDCAKRLSTKLTGKVDLHNLKQGKLPELSNYDTIIIGGSVYIGKIGKEVSDFCSNNLSELKNKRVGLFICGMQEAEAIKQELQNSFPEELAADAVAIEHFGGEFIFRKMNLMERFIVKKIAKTDRDKSNILDENIDKFAQLMNNA